MKYLTVPLNSNFKKSQFNCGKELLDNYLHKQAKQDVKRSLAACFVLADAEKSIIGYYTLSNAAIRRELLPGSVQRKLPESYANLPVTLLGRLAIDKSSAGKGLGQILLMDALKRSYDISLSIGSMAVVVDPIDDQAKRFYLKYDFISLADSGKMFLPMQTVAKLFE